MRRGLVLACVVWGLVGCGDGQPAGVGSGPPTVVDLEDPAAPIMTIGEDGTVIVFRVDPSTGGPTALTMMTAEGQTGELGVDPATGYPTYWAAEGTVYVFSNVRPTEGLADVGIILADGTAAEQVDFEFPPIDPTAVPRTFTMATGEELRAKFTQVAGLFDTAINLTTCINGAILTTASIAGVAVPPVGIPLFTATAGATAAVCAAAFVQLMALDPESTVFTTISDGVSAAGLPATVASCLAKPGVLQCLKTAADLASFSASSLVQGVTATYLRLRDGVAKDVPYQVYCCNGPTQVRAGEMEQWRAVVVEGLGTLPFTYKFDPGDGEPETWLNSNNYGLNYMHRYTDPGTHSLEVSVRDNAGEQVHANASATGPLKFFRVRVYEPLSAVQCCTIFAADITAEGLHAKDAVVIRFEVDQGRRPYSYVFTFGDGKTDTGEFSGDFMNVTHTYTQPGDYELLVTVTDADGDSVSSVPTTVTIGNEPMTPECLDAKRHLCTNIRGQQCSTSTMGNAVSKVSAACGPQEASRFASVAEIYCTVTGLGSFTVETCANQ